MIQSVNHWISSVAIYLVLMGTVLKIIPGPSYEPYIRFYLGLVFILLCMTPVLNLRHVYGEYQQFFRKEQYELFLEESREVTSKFYAVDQNEVLQISE